MKQWLSSVTAEDLLQLAMCADAADEAMLLVRAFDSESMDIAETLARTRDFMDRVEGLFDHGHCLTTPGYTQHCRDILESGELLAFSSEGPRNVGLDLTSTAVSRCLNRMRCWVVLARSVIRSEFPDFEILNSFAIFDLGDAKPRNPAARLGTVHHAAVERLALAFSVDASGLAAELSRLRPVANNFKNERQCDNKEAWVAAWRRTQGHSRQRSAYPGDHIAPVLVRRPLISNADILVSVWSYILNVNLMLFHAPTKGTLRGRPRPAEWSRASLWQSGTTWNAPKVTESRFMVAMLSKALDKDAIDSVTKRAMELYTLCCKRRGGGSARQLTRFDKGVKRGVAKKAGTESAWLKRRRTQVADATANDTVATPPRRNAETLPEWVSSHEKERRTQHDRLVVRAVDAYRNGVLLPSEVTPQIVKAAAQTQKTEVCRDRARATRNAKAQAAASRFKMSQKPRQQFSSPLPYPPWLGLLRGPFSVSKPGGRVSRAPETGPVAAGHCGLD